jgi:hypothetical protein
MSGNSDIRFFRLLKDYHLIRTHLHRLLVAAALSVAVAALAPSRAAAGVRTVASDGLGIRLEITPSYLAPSPVVIDGTTYLRYDFDRSVAPGSLSPGEPELRELSETIRLRGRSGNTVEVVAADYEDLTGVLLAPFSSYVDQDGFPSERRSVKAEAYGRDEFLPSALVVLRRAAETRGTFLGDVDCSPLQYNAARRVLRRYTRIVVQVTFGPAESPKRTPSAGAALAQSVLASGSWFRFTVTDDGIYRFTGQALLGAGIPSSVDPATIRIYGNGGAETPVDENAPAPDDLVENAVALTDRGTPGSLDAADEIVFYGRGSRGWTYNPATRAYSHVLNHFAEFNVYWLTYGGAAKAMSVVPAASDPAAFPATVTGKLFREDEKMNLLSSGMEWLGQSFGAGDQLTLVHALPGIDLASPVRYRIHVGAQSSSSSSFSVFEHGAAIGAIGLAATNVGDYFSLQFKDGIIDRTVVPTFTDAQSQLKFAFNSASAAGKGFLDWIEFFYRRRLEAVSDQFRFDALDTAASVAYAIGGFSGAARAFDVAHTDNVRELLPARVSSDSCVVQYAGTPGDPGDLYVVGPSGFRTPGPLTAVANQDLHGDPTQAENIIITHPDFLDQALRLKAHRERPGHALATIVVTTDQIYNEFGGGVPSPPAIRNYLRYRYLNQTVTPRYALLLGDGDFDYRRINARGTNWVPPWETAQSYDPLNTYPSDDEFVIFNTDDRVDMGIGRLTARSAAEASAMVDKIVAYETGGVRDPWKLRITFVADDGLAEPGSDNGFAHVNHAEAVAAYVPPLFEKRKIYMFQYPTVFAAGGRRKPAVNAAIRDQMNEGSLVVNYSGHGNPRLWAHENVFVRETDFPLLKNDGRSFFLVAATCNFSEFDGLTDQSGGEVLLAMPSAGAVGVFSATRVVFAYDNLLINKAFFANMFPNGLAGPVNPRRLGDIVYDTKQTRTSPNDRKYFLLGDPAMTIGIPELRAFVDSINGIPGTQEAQLRALERSRLSATVRDSAAGAVRPFGGEAEVVVYDANQTAQIVDPTAGTKTYQVDGSVLFRGTQTVAGGAINAEFVVPKDISYGNGLGRVVTYFWNAADEGAGYTSNVRIGGTDSTAALDGAGPSVALYMDSRGFRAGDLVSASPTLIADLADSNGINTSGAGVGHRLEAWLDGAAESVDLTNYYKSKKDTYREGTVEYRLPAQTEGTHRLRMRAWDTYNNSSMSETVFDVGTSMGLRLTNVLNYPNPFTSSTLFTFEQNQVSGIDAQVRIYTVAGRLIQVLSAVNVTDERIQIPWDGRDRDGDQVANGVYLYKVTAKTHDGRYTSEVLGKLSVLR